MNSNRTATCWLCTMLFATAALKATASTTLYVDVNSTNPIPPYSSWAKAATNIQDAVDMAAAGDEVLVTNGVYAQGGRAVFGTMTNRVAITKLLHVRSVNGPAVTVIRGYQVPGTTNGPGAIRCAYVTNMAVLEGFTLTGGATHGSGDVHEQLGGGVWCEPGAAVATGCVLTGNAAAQGGGGAYQGGLYNCIVSNNWAGYAGGGVKASSLTDCTLIDNAVILLGGNGGGASESDLYRCVLSGNSAYEGGGAYEGTLESCVLSSNLALPFGAGGGARFAVLKNCLLTGNSAQYGGGAHSCGLRNCTLVGNWATYGGGAEISTNGWATNCIVYFNHADQYPNVSGGSLSFAGFVNYCCTIPLPQLGIGNFTNEPLFIDLAGANLRLQPNSPCIDAGNNASAPFGSDLDGHPRIAVSNVDLGAYEFYPSPYLRITNSGNTVTIAWPLWASNFVLQSASNLPPGPGGWSNISVQPAMIGSENVLYRTADGHSKYFRLNVP